MRAVLSRWCLCPLPKSQWLAIILAAVAILIMLIWSGRMGRQQLPPVGGVPVVVEVQGAVRHPGIFILDMPANSMQAIAAAGGHLCSQHTVIPPSISAQLVSTGQSLHISCLDRNDLRVEILTMSPAARLTLGLKLDLNQASALDLALVPGMQSRWAETIVARRSHQNWRTLSELQEISGIGPRTLEKLARYLEVRETWTRTRH